MLSRTTLKRHAALVDRMASHTGTDLQEAALRGQITIGEIDDAVLRCTACTRPCDCEALLQSAEGPVGAAPEFCRNAGLFAALRR